VLVLALCASESRAGADAEAPADGTQSFTLSIDLRAVASDGLTSYLEGGGGKLRFDADHDGVRIGRIFLDYRGRLTDTLTARATINTYGDHDNNPVDVTEAYLDWRPFPAHGWRWHAKLGVFYPPVSLENRAAGWSSAYSLSSSAINTWLGEEFRTIGAELTATWLGSQQEAWGDLSLIGGVYEYNDDAGLLLSFRGWSINDRQTPLFGRLHFIPIFFLVPPPNAEFRPGFEFFHKIDNRPGYYAGLEWKRADFITLRALHYDNRGDLRKFNYDFDWLTRYDSLGARVELPRDWTVIGQWLRGDTSVGYIPSGVPQYYLDFDAWFALLSRRTGAHRVTLRYDEFGTDQEAGAGFRNFDEGKAWTFAWLYDVNRHWQLALESLWIDSQLTGRVQLGEPVSAKERQVQLAVRYTLRN
jgi:hypothetical protein